MTSDYLITVGLLVGVFSIPAMISAYADGRFPYAPLTAFALSAAMISLAMFFSSARYSLGDVPIVVVRVVADILP